MKAEGNDFSFSNVNIHQKAYAVGMPLDIQKDHLLHYAFCTETTLTPRKYHWVIKDERAGIYVLGEKKCLLSIIECIYIPKVVFLCRECFVTKLLRRW